MVKIPYIKIPGVRVGSIGPASNIGTGGATPAPPAPITYLTQWKIVGNSQVHTDPYLTSWKVSGNSVVDNNTILSCGDLGQDGKYHVKISNGVDIYDIPLTEPLRKVRDVADKIEFSNGVATLTRYLKSKNLGGVLWAARTEDIKAGVFSTLSINDRKYASNTVGLTALYLQINSIGSAILMANAEDKTFALYYKADGVGTALYIYDSDYATSTPEQFRTAMDGVELIYELATPTIETIQVPDIAVSPTDTYTSANETPYSAFEHTEHKEIWSCGEYNPIDGKYHILVQPQGGSIVDIALDEPLRKVNNVADTIEFPSGTDGKALVTRNLKSVDAGDFSYMPIKLGNQDKYRMVKNIGDVKEGSKALCASYPNNNAVYTGGSNAVSFGSGNALSFYDADYDQQDSATAFKAHLDGVELIYELATPTTELVDVPQIEEAESYSMVISQGAKAVEWSSFETNSE